MKKLVVIISLVSLLFVQSGFRFAVYAAVDRPDAPDAPTTSNNTPSVDEPDAPAQVNEPDKPDNYQNDQEENTQETQTEEDTHESNSDEEPSYKDEDGEISAPEVEDLVDTDIEADPKTTGGNSQDGKVGDAAIETGDANGTGSINNTGNTNVASNNQQESGIGGVAISNTGNGAGSQNTGSVALDDQNSTIQDNNADLDNSLKINTDSGTNSASKNVGNSTINTGEANATGTITNFANTNISGAMVSEFNVIDDQVGDLVLDYAANCISGCGGGDILIKNAQNGSDSTNTGNVVMVDDDLTFQNNDATVENELILSANSGNNAADNNTGGDSSIETGDANVVGNVLNFLNNNIAGNVVYGVVNIFGDLVGDIVMPENYFANGGAGGTDVSSTNTGNGSGSDNTTDVALVSADEFYQFNSADIVNNLILDAETGNNATSDNTGGNNSIETGDVDVDVSVLNVANTNVIGEDWWIVMVNNAGEWMGQIFAPNGSFVGGFFAAAPGSSAQVADNGAITVTNDGNGADSQNTGEVALSDSSTTAQNNNAAITNNIDLSANSGGNSASRNTGGTNSIDTGDANVQLNLVNFVNNNFAGGNVFLTVVNVFGNWMGDFVAPGGKKPEAQESNNEVADSGIGGSSQIPSSSANNSSGSTSSSSSSSSSSTDSSNNSSVPTVLAATLAPKHTPVASGKIASGVSDQADEEELAYADVKPLGSTSEAKSKTRINLAWGLAAIPLFFVYRVIRQRLIG